MKSVLLFWFLSLITSILTAILETFRLIKDALNYDRTDLKKLPAHVSLYLAQPLGFDELEYFIRTLVYYNPKLELLSIFIKEGCVYKSECSRDSSVLGHSSKDSCVYMESLNERLKSISYEIQDLSNPKDLSGTLDRKGLEVVLLHEGVCGIEQTLKRYSKLSTTKRKELTVQNISDWQTLPDPDLLICSGSSQCLQLGEYPFWQLRLCEIRFVPWFFSLSSIIVRASLYSFSNADQRVGR